jgi:hypothetical protein
VTCSYTNSAGTSGRTATLDTNLSNVPARRLLPFRLAAGDTGVRSVQSVTIATAGVGTFNLVLLRRLATAYMPGTNGQASDLAAGALALGMPKLYSDSCLALMAIATSSTANGTLHTHYTIARG